MTQHNRTTSDEGLFDEPHNIIIAEDAPVSRQVMKLQLESMGHVIREAETGLEAVRLYNEHPADIVFLDWLMPEMDGIEVCHNIRGQADGDLPFIVMVTGRTRGQDLEAAMEAGIDDFLAKPFSTEVLMHRTRLAVHGYRARKLLRETEDRYHILFLSCGDYIVLFAREDGRIINVNQSGLDSLKYEHDELQGKHIDSLFEDTSLHSRCSKTLTFDDPIEAHHITAEGLKVPVEIRVALVSLAGRPVIQAHIRDATERLRNERRLADYANQLKIENKSLEEASYLDPLTGVANRRWLDQSLEREIQRCRRGNDELSLIMIDVDFFKLYNDNYGHAMGDEALKQIANAIDNALFRSSDSLARFGGEEFAVLLPETSNSGAIAVAERIRVAVADTKIPHEFSIVASHITISVGVSSRGGSSIGDAKEMIECADGALYRAKAAGRNRVAYNDSPPD